MFQVHFTQLFTRKSRNIKPYNSPYAQRSIVCSEVIKDPKRVPSTMKQNTSTPQMG
jgi:hypothetical protein